MALLETPTTAQIERLIRSWRTDNPAFFWCPTKPSNFFLDQQRRVQGRPSGRVDVGYGGVKVAVPNGDSYLSFPTTLGLSTNGNFLCMLLVYIKDPANVTGSFLKIGSGSDGVSIGGGITTHEDSGSKLILLRETFAWDRSPVNAFVPGMNVLSFYFTTDGVLGGLNHTTGVGVDVTPGGTVYLAPTVSTNINGAGGSRGSNATVCAVGIWPEAYNNTATVAKRGRLSAGLDKLSGRHYLPLFTPERVTVPVQVSGGGVLISATAGNAVADGVTAQINQARRIDATPGNAAAAGVTAKIDQARRIDATVGNAAAAGVDAQIITAGAVVIACTPGNAAANGVTAQINQARLIAATVGNAVAAGVDASITTASGVVINASPGNAVAAGIAATLISNVRVNATPGNATADGVTASVSNGGVAPTAAGGYDDDKPKKKKFFAEVNGKLLVYGSAKAAANALNKAEKAPEQPAEAIEQTKPEVAIDLPAVEAYAEVSGQIDEYNAAYNSRRFEAILKLFRDMEDEDEVELLLLAL